MSNHATNAGPSLHPLHRAWRLLPARARRRWLARASAWVAPRPDRVVPARCQSVIVYGETGRSSGLGEGARIMDRALEQLGVRHAAMAAGSGRLAVADGAWPAASALVMHVNAPQLPGALMRLGRRQVRGRIVIGYWAWELPVVPDNWRPSVRHVHEVWVPSRFTAQALEPLLPGRVRVVPHALGLALPQPSQLDRQAFGLPVDAVVVLCSFSLASSFVRKNPLAAIASFRKAFGDSRSRLLLLKVGHTEHYPGDLQLLRDAIAGATNIRLETRMLPEADMHALTRCCDIVLSLHRSEGFGLVPAQAMLLERPVVATDWSATAEFLDRSCGVPIGYRLLPAVDPRGVFEAPGAVWADADVDAAADALRRLAIRPEERSSLGRAARATALERFDGRELKSALFGLDMLAG